MISSESAIVSLIELTPTTAPTNPLATATQAASEMGPVTSEKAFSGILTSVLEPAPESAPPEPHFEETYFAEEIAPESHPQLSEVFAAVEETTFSAPAPEAPMAQVDWTAAPLKFEQPSAQLQPEAIGTIPAPVFHAPEAFTPQFVKAEFVARAPDETEQFISIPQSELSRPEVAPHAVVVPAEGAVQAVPDRSEPRVILETPVKAASQETTKPEVHPSAARKSETTSVKSKVQSPPAVQHEAEQPAVTVEARPTEVIATPVAPASVEVTPQMAAAMFAPTPLPATPAPELPGMIPGGQGNDHPEPMRTGGFSPSPLFQAEVARRYQTSAAPVAQSTPAIPGNVASRASGELAAPSPSPSANPVRVQAAMAGLTPVVPEEYHGQLPAAPSAPAPAPETVSTPASAARGPVNLQPELQAEIVARPVEVGHEATTPIVTEQQPAVESGAPVKLTSTSIPISASQRESAAPVPVATSKVAPESPGQSPISSTTPVRQTFHSEVASVSAIPEPRSEPVIAQAELPEQPGEAIRATVSAPAASVQTAAMPQPQAVTERENFQPAAAEVSLQSIPLAEAPPARVAPSIREGTQEIKLPQPRKAESLFSNGEPVAVLKPLTQRPLATAAPAMPAAPRSVPQPSVELPQTAVATESAPVRAALPEEPVQTASPASKSAPAPVAIPLPRENVAAPVAQPLSLQPEPARTPISNPLPVAPAQVRDLPKQSAAPASSVSVAAPPQSQNATATAVTVIAPTVEARVGQPQPAAERLANTPPAILAPVSSAPAKSLDEVAVPVAQLAARSITPVPARQAEPAAAAVAVTPLPIQTPEEPAKLARTVEFKDSTPQEQLAPSVNPKATKVVTDQPVMPQALENISASSATSTMVAERLREPDPITTSEPAQTPKAPVAVIAEEATLPAPQEKLVAIHASQFLPSQAAPLPQSNQVTVEAVLSQSSVPVPAAVQAQAAQPVEIPVSAKIQSVAPVVTTGLEKPSLSEPINISAAVNVPALEVIPAPAPSTKTVSEAPTVKMVAPQLLEATVVTPVTPPSVSPQVISVPQSAKSAPSVGAHQTKAGLITSEPVIAPAQLATVEATPAKTSPTTASVKAVTQLPEVAKQTSVLAAPQAVSDKVTAPPQEAAKILPPASAPQQKPMAIPGETITAPVDQIPAEVTPVQTGPATADTKVVGQEPESATATSVPTAALPQEQKIPSSTVAAPQVVAVQSTAPTQDPSRNPTPAAVPQTEPVAPTASQNPVESKPSAPSALLEPSATAVAEVESPIPPQNHATPAATVSKEIASKPAVTEELPTPAQNEAPVIPAQTDGKVVPAATAPTLSPAPAVPPGTEPFAASTSPVLVAPAKPLSTVAEPAPVEPVATTNTATVTRSEASVAKPAEMQTEASHKASTPVAVDAPKLAEVQIAKGEVAPTVVKVQAESATRVSDKIPVEKAAARQPEPIEPSVAKSAESPIPAAPTTFKTEPAVTSPTARQAASPVGEPEPSARQNVPAAATLATPAAKPQPVEVPAQPTVSAAAPAIPQRTPVARPGANRAATGRTISGMVRTSTDLRFVNPNSVPMTAKSVVSADAAPKVVETKPAPAPTVARVQAPTFSKAATQETRAELASESTETETPITAAELEVSALKYPVAVKEGATVETKTTTPKSESAVVVETPTKLETIAPATRDTTKPVEIESPKVAARTSMSAQSNGPVAANSSTPLLDALVQPPLVHSQRQTEAGEQAKPVAAQPRLEPAVSSGAAMSNNGSETGFQRGGEGQAEARESQTQKAGMPAAKLVSSVRNDQNRNNSAEPSVLERAETPRRRETTAPAESMAGPHGLEWIANLSSIPSIKAPEAGTHAESASPLRNFPPVIDWLARNIESEVRAVRQFNAEHLSVVVRPDAQTELVIDLKNHNGRVEATARCERGDSAALAAGWSTLQAHLAQRGVDLAALPSGGTGSSNNTFSSNTQTQTGRDGQSGRRMPQEENPDSPSAFGSNPGRRNLEKPRAKLPGLNRAQEWWA